MTLNATMPSETPEPRPAAPPLLPLVRQALTGANGRAALRFRPAGRLATQPGHRRFADAVLLDATVAGGGAVFDTLAGESLLMGAAPAVAARTAAALAQLAGGAGDAALWQLPRDGAALLAWAADARLAPPSPPTPPWPNPAGLEARVQALTPDQVLRPRTLVSAEGRRLGRRIRLLAQAAEGSLRAHAEQLLALRLLPGLAAWARDVPGLRLVPLPRPLARPTAGWPDLPPAGRPGLFGVLPLVALADRGLAEARALLAARGWSLALEGLSPGLPPAGAPPYDVAGLPGDLLLLRWHPGLAAPPAPPGRLLLTGCDGAAALAWGRTQGVRAMSGTAVEATA